MTVRPLHEISLSPFDVEMVSDIAYHPGTDHLFVASSGMGRIFEFAIEGIFKRGDINADNRVNLADAIGALRYLFLEADTPVCLDAADADNSGRIAIDDAIQILLYAFRGQTPEGLSFSLCGVDTDEDNLSCRQTARCLPDGR